MRRVLQITIGQYWVRVALVAAAIVSGCAMAFVGFVYALIAGAGVFVGVLVLRWPLLGLYMTLAALPLERIGAYESAFGTIRASQLLGALTIAAWVWQMMIVRRSRV